MAFIPSFSVDSKFEPWAEWDICTVTCGKGTQRRRRVCSAAINDGTPCPSKVQNRKLYLEVRDCQIKQCPDPMWTSWTNTGCSVTCGFGTLTKQRQCEDFITGETMNPLLECKATSRTDYIQVQNCENPHCQSKSSNQQHTGWSRKIETVFLSYELPCNKDLQRNT